MTIILNDLNLKNTEIGILREPQRKEKIKQFIDQVKEDYEDTEARINQFWTDNEAEYKKLKKTSSDSEVLEFWDKFNNEADIIKLIQPKTLEKIAQLFKVIPTNSDIKKALKSVYEEDNIKDYINDTAGGVIWQVYTIDFINEIYLQSTEAFLNEILTDSNLTYNDLDAGKVKGIFTDLLENGITAFGFINYEGLSTLTDIQNKGREELRKLVNNTRRIKATDNPELKQWRQIFKGAPVGQIETWWKATNTYWGKTQAIKDIVGTDGLGETALQKIVDELTDLTQAINDKQIELNKANDQIKDLVKTGGAADAIKALQKDITDLEAELKKAKKERDDALAKAGGGGTGTIPIIAGSEEWKATALFLTEPDQYNSKALFNDLYSGNWTTSQKTAIYNMLKAAEKNSDKVRSRWPQHFRN